MKKFFTHAFHTVFAGHTQPMVSVEPRAVSHSSEFSDSQSVQSDEGDNGCGDSIVYGSQATSASSSSSQSGASAGATAGAN